MIAGVINKIIMFCIIAEIPVVIIFAESILSQNQNLKQTCRLLNSWDICLWTWLIAEFGTFLFEKRHIASNTLNTKCWVIFAVADYDLLKWLKAMCGKAVKVIIVYGIKTNYWFTYQAQKLFVFQQVIEPTTISILSPLFNLQD